MRHAAPDGWGAPVQVFARLEGRWRLDRRIEDAGGGASFTGEALFTPRADGALAYREQGRLRLPDGSVLDARQDYVFRTEDDGFSIFFPLPERLFQRVALFPGDDGLSGAATHPCGHDIYHSRYVFSPDGSFLSEHRVRGPRKDYFLRTQHCRALG